MKLDSELRINHKAILRNSDIAVVAGGIFLLMGVTWFGNLLIAFGLLTLLNVYVLVPTSKRFQESLLPRVEARYERLINFVLHKRNPVWIFLGTLGL